MSSLATKRLLDRRPFPVQSNFLRQQRVRAFGNDDAARVQFAVGVAGRHADDRAILPKQIDDCELRVDLGTHLFRFGRIPAVER
jgi:hypothetical protein